MVQKSSLLKQEVKRLVDAVSECMRYWVSNCDTTHMCVGSTVGPNIFVKICGWSTSQISRELVDPNKKRVWHRIPKKIEIDKLRWWWKLKFMDFGMNLLSYGRSHS